MVASNTDECFELCIGKRVTGFLRDAPTLTSSRSLVLEDGTALSFSNNGSFWIEPKEKVRNAVQYLQDRLRSTQDQLKKAIELAGKIPEETRKT